jgi:hypothetical protein
VAVYAAIPAYGSRPPIDAVLTTWPGSPCSSIDGRNEDPVHHAEEVDRHQPVPLVEVDLPHRAGPGDAGVVAEDVDVAEGALARAASVSTSPGAPRSPSRPRRPVDAGGRRFQPLAVDVAHDDAHSPCELRSGSADAAGRP